MPKGPWTTFHVKQYFLYSVPLSRFFKNKILFFLFFIYFADSIACASQSFERRIHSALDFLAHHQTSGTEGYEPGQWRSQVTSYTPSVFGIGRYAQPFEDPSVFVASSVGNVLAETYELDSRYGEIPGMLEKIPEGLERFRWGSLFNFYPWKIVNGQKIGGPRFMYLAPHLRGAMFVPPDADTTSVTYTFLHYLNSIQKDISPKNHDAFLPEQVVKAYAQFLDLNRKPHPFNAVQKQFNTGAFLTWLTNEKDPEMPGTFAPPAKGPRIPIHINDVDCVVNTNVLKLMTYAGMTSTRGYKNSCDHINKISRQRKFFYCGMYYPSNYVLPYTIAADLEAGASCLQPSKSFVLQYLVSKQQEDGSWRNNLLARPDYIQSTVWALNALMILGNPKNKIHRYKVQMGVRYLLSQSQKDSAGRVFWPGQVFFAGPLISRYPIVWRSTAYTTALAVKALVLADKKWFER
ncbi:MAG: hypothetical protein ACXVCP_17900 [Bdellovibrio sp.]